MTTHVTLLTQADCHLCEHAKHVLDHVAQDFPLQVTEVDLASPDGKRTAAETGMLFPPGVLLDGQPFTYGRLSERKLRQALKTRTASGQ